MHGTNGDYIRSLAIGPDGTVYAGADNHENFIKAQQLIKQQDDASSIKSLIVDATGTIFAGSDNGNIYQIDNGMYSKILEASHEIKRLVIDKNSNLFAGVDGNLVYKKEKKSSIFYKMMGIESDNEHILALTIGPEDILYAVGTEGILYTSKNFK